MLMLMHCIPRALRKTGNRGLQPALDYLQEHEGSDGADSDGEDGQDVNITSAGGSDAEAKVGLAVFAPLRLQQRVLVSPAVEMTLHLLLACSDAYPASTPR